MIYATKHNDITTTNLIKLEPCQTVCLTYQFIEIIWKYFCLKFQDRFSTRDLTMVLCHISMYCCKCRHCRFTLESLNFNLHVWHYTMFVWGICVCWKNDTERSIRVVSLGRLLTEALAFVEKVTRNDLYVLSPSGGYLLLDNYRCVSLSVMTVLRSFFSLALFLHWVTSFLSQVERVFITHCARSTYLGIKTNRT